LGDVWESGVVGGGGGREECLVGGHAGYEGAGDDEGEEDDIDCAVLADDVFDARFDVLEDRWARSVFVGDGKRQTQGLLAG
jgi:hypothetical protein